MLAQITHCHNASKERCQRNTEGHHIGRGVEQKLHDDAKTQTLTHQLIDIPPHEIHHEDKHHDEKREYHWPQEGFEGKTMYGLHSFVLLNQLFALRRRDPFCKVSSFTIKSAMANTIIVVAPTGKSIFHATFYKPRNFES